MKKLLLLATSALLLLAGCAKEEQGLSTLLDGEATTVTFTASMDDGVMTKAADDGDGAAASVNRCIMEIYYDGSLFARDIQQVTHGDKITATFTAQVVANRTYKVVFWADHVESTSALETDLYYTTDAAQPNGGLQSIALKGTYAGNNDARDAFFHCGEYTIAQGGSSFGGTGSEIYLKRPFAQINVITTDWDKVCTLSTLKPDKVDVIIQGPLTKFNAVTGTADADPDVTDLHYNADLYKTPASGTDATLSMDYIFASATKEVIDIAWKAQKTGNTDVTHYFTNIPCQRNYRTNIKGALLTSQGQWSVTVDSGWDSGDSGENDINVYYAEAATNSDVKNAIQSKTNDTSTNGDNLQVNIASATNDDVIIPDNTPGTNTPEIILNFKQLSSNQEIVIRDEKHPATGAVESGAKEYEGTVTVIVPEGTTAQQVKILTDKSTVTVRGEYGTVIASCAPHTIVIEAGTTVGTLKVEKGNVDLLGTVTSIVNATAEAEADKDVVNVYMFEGGVWTNMESEKGGKLVPVYPSVTNGTKKYFTFYEAIEDAEDGGTLNIMGDLSETPDHAPVMKTSKDVTFTASTPVTVTVAPTTKTSILDSDGMVYMTSAGERKTITVGENVTLRFPADAVGKGAMYLGYASTTPVDMVLNGHIEAYEPYIGAQSTLTVNPSGSLTSVSECLLVRKGATVDIDGTGASWSEETPQVKLGYAWHQGGVVTFKNTFVNAGAYWNQWKRQDEEPELVLDNTTLTANNIMGQDGAYSIVMKNNSIIKLTETFATLADGTVTVEAGSVIKANAFDNKGQIVADVPESEGEYLVAEYTGDGTASLATFGNLTSNVGYFIVKDNKLYVKVDDNIAVIGSTPYATLADAFAAAGEGAEIKLIADANIASTITAGVDASYTLNLNGRNITSDADAIQVTRGTLTLIGDGTFDTKGTDSNYSFHIGGSGKFIIGAEGKDYDIVINDLVRSTTETTIWGGTISKVCCYAADGGTKSEVTINGGKFGYLDNTGYWSEECPTTIYLNDGIFGGFEQISEEAEPYCKYVVKDGYVLGDNPDSETKTDYPWAVIVDPVPTYTDGAYSGKGILVAGLYWAPVNCGYEAASGDYKGYIYGKLYQWGRKDGQGYYRTVGKTTYEDATYPTTENGNLVESQTASPEAAKFYYGSYNWYNGITPAASDLWGTTKTAYDPCPNGWRVPTKSELDTLKTVDSELVTGKDVTGLSSGSYSGRLFGEILFFPAAGERGKGGGASNRNSKGCYWSSTLDEEYGDKDGYYLDFIYEDLDIITYRRTCGLSVRCVSTINDAQ